MTDKQLLGRLEPVFLREYWKKEDAEFTPWLSENLNFLSDAVGMSLELIETESRVGPFRADLLCRDNDTETYVLIENQLEQTDHLHLGQLMTYAAGLDAVRIIWIAQKFNEEHRAALDWLNRITDEGFQFFGIEVELWKIGDSLPAPRFNIVAKPNDWSKIAKSQKQAELSERAAMYREIWADVLKYLGENYPDLKIPNTSGLHWIRFPVPNTRCVLSYAPTQKKMNLYLLFRSDSPRGWYEFIFSDASQFEIKINQKFSWNDKKDGSGWAQATLDFDHLTDKSKIVFYEKIGRLLTEITAYLAGKAEEFINSRS